MLHAEFLGGWRRKKDFLKVKWSENHVGAICRSSILDLKCAMKSYSHSGSTDYLDMLEVVLVLGDGRLASCLVGAYIHSDWNAFPLETPCFTPTACFDKPLLNSIHGGFLQISILIECWIGTHLIRLYPKGHPVLRKPYVPRWFLNNSGLVRPEGFIRVGVWGKFQSVGPFGDNGGELTVGED